jgi:hypothetical protein
MSSKVLSVHIDDLDFRCRAVPSHADHAEFEDLCLLLGFIPGFVYISHGVVVGGLNICWAVKTSVKLQELTGGYVNCIDLGENAARKIAVLTSFVYLPGVAAPLKKNGKPIAGCSNTGVHDSGIPPERG